MAITAMTSSEKATDLEGKSYSNFKVTYHGDGGKTRTEIVKARRAYEAEAQAKRNLRSGEWGVTATRMYNSKEPPMTRLNCREVVRVGNAGMTQAEAHDAVAADKKATLEALRKSQARRTPSEGGTRNALDPRTGRLNCREQNAGTTASVIKSALESRGLGRVFSSIENNPATRGEVVCWGEGGGHPVYSVTEAIKLAQKYQDAD